MNSQTLTNIKTINDGFEVDYEICYSNIQQEIDLIEKELANDTDLLNDINQEIEKHTNNADKFDYTIAVSSGIITGLIDAFFIGELNFESAKADSHKHVNVFIEKYAKWKGYSDNGKGLQGAIEFLEKEFPVAQDNIWKGKNISSTRLHHLEDIAHHPTLFGLVSAIFVQYFRISFFVNKKGEWKSPFVPTTPKDILKIWLPIVISGALNWLIRMAESKYVQKMGKDIPRPIHLLITALAQAPAVISILKVIDNWFGHLVSDMGGSKNTPGGGMGISGIFLSILKEISSLPIMKESQLPNIVSDLYSKEKIDMRTELAIVESLGKQSIPVILNECIVRLFYFVRHLIEEKEKHSEWKDVNWSNTLPFNNRTIMRMITISSGTFVAVDMADAAIRAAVKSGGNQAKFVGDLLLRINFVGIGRFTIALVNDIRWGIKQERYRNDRIRIMSHMIELGNAKIFYKEADMWQTAENATKSIDILYDKTLQSVIYIKESMIAMLDSITTINSSPIFEEMSPTLKKEIYKTLKY